MRVILVGPYPPPYGGISVHLKRFKRYLENDGIGVSVYSEAGNGTETRQGIKAFSSYKSFLFAIPFLKGDIIHFHATSKRVRMLLWIYKAFFNKVILTIHGESLIHQYNSSNRIIRSLLMFSIKRLDKIICVNPKTVLELEQLGIMKARLSNIPAYVKPTIASSDIGQIPKYVWNFVESAEFLISGNGSIKFHNHQDAYGIDMLLQLTRQLRSNGKNVKLIFSLVGVKQFNEEQKNYHKYLKRLINDLGLSEHVLLYESNSEEFYPILRQSKLFIRPTNVDGYGISVEEAVHFGVPALASDVCERPVGTQLFKSRDRADLYFRAVGMIEHYSHHQKIIENLPASDHARRIVEIYNEG